MRSLEEMKAPPRRARPAKKTQPGADPAVLDMLRVAVERLYVRVETLEAVFVRVDRLERQWALLIDRMRRHFTLQLNQLRRQLEGLDDRDVKTANVRSRRR